MAVRRTPQETPEARLEAADFAGPTAHHAEAESMVAAPTSETPPILPERDDMPRARRSFPAPPPLHLVQPGDLITAQYFNDLVRAVQNLQARMGDMEQIYDAAYRQQRSEAAR